MRQRGKARTTSAAATWLTIAVAVTASVLCGPPAAAGVNGKRPAGDGTVAVEPVCGTSNAGRAGCFALRRTDVPAARGVRPYREPPAGYAPTDLRSAYGLPADGGAGATIAIITAHDNMAAEADLAVYRAQYGLPACTTDNGCYRLIGQDGGAPPRGTFSGSWDKHAALGLDMASAIAPAANLLLVAADSEEITDLGAAVNQAVAQGARFISNGYGFGFESVDATPGNPEDPGQTTAWDPYFDHPGVAIVAAAGDYNHGPSFPASSRHVTAVGGTTLSRDDSGRGWSETVWHTETHGTGSGCSAYEPKPAFQTDRGCANRTVADVAAVADPATGVAIYDGRWSVYGGTSIAAAIVTGVYAVAGTPAEGTYPNSYPYTRRSALHDITTGHNGGCQPTYLCTAQPGYDGPTGLGTPNGTTAFHAGPYGTLTGTITDTTGAAKRPVPGATVRAGTADAVTDHRGRYTLQLAPGAYRVTAAKFGYRAGSTRRATVTDGGITTANLRLTALPHATVKGRVTDGSGHGWPLYAKITVAGMPGATFTDPVTGRYRLDLPRNREYRLTVTAAVPGYQTASAEVSLGSVGVRTDVALPVDADTCTAPGNRERVEGETEGFDVPGTPAGWTVHDATTGGGWLFDDPGRHGNRTGGDGGYATADSDHLGMRNQQDSTLTAPAADLSAATAPVVGFDTDYRGYRRQSADVELSLDGGEGWSSIWHHADDSVRGPTHVRIPIPQAAGKSGVLVRFHFTAAWGNWWQVDNVFIGDRHCELLPGGLIVGRVTDANTGTGVAGAQVIPAGAPGTAAGTPGAPNATGAPGAPAGTPNGAAGSALGSAARAGAAGSAAKTPGSPTGGAGAGAGASTLSTPDDPWLGDGFYTVFAPEGTRQVITTGHRYAADTAQVTVVAGATIRRDVRLAAGRVTVRQTKIEKSIGLGTIGTARVRLTNTGTAPATVTVGEQPRGFQPLAGGAGAGAPTRRMGGTFTPHRIAAASTDSHGAPAVRTGVNAGAGGAGAGAPGTEAGAPGTEAGAPGTEAGAPGTGADTAGAGGAWASIADLPRAIRDNLAAAHGGRLYSAFGMFEKPDYEYIPLSTLYAYDPATGAWSELASAANARSAPAGAFIDGRLYAAGGWRPDGSPDPTLERYDPATDTWVTMASMPRPLAGAGSAVVGGRLYVVGGCPWICGDSTVQAYDPATNTWTLVADYPEPVSWTSCAGIGGKLYCAGGVREYGDDYLWPTAATYAYDPATNTWTPRADFPLKNVWAAASTAAEGRLLVNGGIVDGDMTNESFAYDPDADVWSRLPSSGRPSYRGAGACGFYRVGGDGTSAEVLPGHAGCADTSPWISAGTGRITLRPGASATLTVTLDAAPPAISQPGTYTSRLTLEADTPYPATTLPVTMTVPPPPTWGRLSGTVTSAADGSALPDTTIQIDTSAGSYTLATNDRGEYVAWLDARDNPAQIIAAKENYQPQLRTVTVTAGATTTESFALKKKP